MFSKLLNNKFISYKLKLLLKGLNISQEIPLVLVRDGKWHKYKFEISLKATKDLLVNDAQKLIKIKKK